MEELPELLVRKREEAGLSQQELAELLGVTQWAIWSWEAGKSHPRISLRGKLSVLLGIPTKLLTKSKESSTTQAPAARARPQAREE